MEMLAPDTVVDGAIMDALQVANAISKIFDAQRIKTKNVATSVSGHSVIVKRVPLPLMSEEELYDRIPSEASQHIPFIKLFFAHQRQRHAFDDHRMPGYRCRHVFGLDSL